MRHRALAVVSLSILLGACAHHVNLFYRPLTFCVGVLDPAGGVIVEEVLAFRLDSVSNRTTATAGLYPGYFFVRARDTRLATRAAQLLTTLPAPLAVAPSGTARGPWIVAMRVQDYERGGFSEPDGSGTVRVRFLNLIYDPSLGVSRDSSYLTVNTSGRSVISGVARRPCTIAAVRGLSKSP